MVPELLAADIQPGTLPVPTKQNLADAATRSGRTRAAPLREPPAWMAALEVADYGPFDDVYAARTRRIPAEFFPAIPLAKSGDAGGPGDPADGERIGEAKKPGPPPRARSASAVRHDDAGERAPRRARSAAARAAAREGRDLDGSRVSREELALRAEAFAGFERWCHDNGARSDVVFTGEPDEADVALVGYVRHLFR